MGECTTCDYAPYGSKDKHRCQTCFDITPLGKNIWKHYKAKESDEKKELPNSKRSGVWLWQIGIIVPDGNSAEYPICPFCTTSPFQEPVKDPLLPDRCPECGAKLELEK